LVFHQMYLLNLSIYNVEKKVYKNFFTKSSNIPLECVCDSSIHRILVLVLVQSQGVCFMYLFIFYQIIGINLIFLI
jgi:hypothetical protein